MPAHLDIGGVERACLRDHCSVEIADDPKRLGRRQGGARDLTIDAVDRHSDKPGDFLEDHVP